MPAESPLVADPEGWNDERVKPEWYAEIRQQLPRFDPRTTPTTTGAIAEAFRTYPQTQRSLHPLVSACARGPLAETITSEHSLEFGEGRHTPFEQLYALGGFTLRLGVGFDQRVGEAETYFVSTRALVDFAVQYFGGVHRQERGYAMTPLV